MAAIRIMAYSPGLLRSAMSTAPSLSNTYQGPVQADWIDYNDHMSEAYYVLVFGFATDELYERLGLGDDFRRRNNSSAYTVEAHINYLQEVSLGEPLTVSTQILAAEGKKLRFCHTMHHGTSGEQLAFTELLTLYVDTTTGKTMLFPDDILANIAAAINAQPQQEAPALAQRLVGQRKKN